ncbi:uncharacterized protein LOC131048765 isoform X2 [Cryptomeria japonica]|nr:uncharacterized protein LOC131048765 isoform X2 [Cryptomeria japonica]
MAYSMAITRLLNGVVDQSDKKQKRSINDSAEEIGLPRLLVDIRHESAHNRLPALPLLRLASKKALNWLNSNYWEPQKDIFPNIRPEIKSRLHVLALNIQRKQSARTAGLQEEMHSVTKQANANLRRLVKFCTAYPEEVVSVLLEECLLKEVDLGNMFMPVFSNAMQEDVFLDNSNSSQLSRENWKSVIDAICLRKPEIRTMLIKAAVEIITAIEANAFEQKKGNLDLSNNLGEPLEPRNLIAINHPYTQELVFWVTWLLKDLEIFWKAESKKCNSTDAHISLWYGPVCKGFLQELLFECLKSLAYSSALSEVVLIITELLGSKSLTCKIQYLVYLQKFDQERQYCASDSLDQGNTHNIVVHELIHNKDIVEIRGCNSSLVETDTQATFARQTVFLEKAKQQFESLKMLQAKCIDKTISESNIHERKLDEEPSLLEGPWSIVENWKPCAIGMLPSLSNLRGVLPVLECTRTKLEGSEVHVNDERCNQSYEATKCMSPTMCPDAKMEENELRNYSKHSDQVTFPDKLVRGDDKRAFDVRQGEYKDIADNYYDVSNQQNVKKLKKEHPKEIADESNSPNASHFVRSQPHSAILGQLFADGSFKHFGFEELKTIQSAVHIFESFRH